MHILEFNSCMRQVLIIVTSHQYIDGQPHSFMHFSGITHEIYFLYVGNNIFKTISFQNIFIF